MPRTSILVCGEALYDVFVGAEDGGGFAMDARIGGSAFNVAMGAARLGLDSALLTGVSRDVLGDKLVASLEWEGVSARHLARKDARTTLALVALDAEGVAQYSFYGEGSADRMVGKTDLPETSDFDALVFGCFSMLTQPTGNSFLHLAGKTNALVALDPNVRLTVEPDLAVWRERITAFAEHADIVKVSEDDLFALYGEDADFGALAQGWLDQEAKLVAITHGGEGATFYSRHGVQRADPDPIVVVDTVGAGDTFLAALLTVLLESDDPFSRDTLDHALPIALNASAITCTRRGADLPRRNEVKGLSH